MDAFKKLKLKLIQDVENDADQINQVQEELETEEIIQTEKERIGKYLEQLYSKYKDMFTRVGEVRNFEYNVEFVPNFRSFQQKGRKIPIHLQDQVEKELCRLQREGHIEKFSELGDNICVSPAVIAKKSDNSIKIALDAKELNKQIIKKRMQMPNLDDLRDRSSIKIAMNKNQKLWASKIDFKYAFGHVKLAKETSNHCVFAIAGGKATGHYRFVRGFYGLADMPVVFQEKLDRVLQKKFPAWQDDILVITRGNVEEHYKDITELMDILNSAGYRISFEKSELFRKEVEWCGFNINSSGISPKHSRVDAIAKITPPKTLKEVRSFLGSVQYLSRYINNLSSKTAPLRNLLKKTTSWKWGEPKNSAFEKNNSEIIKIVPLKRYDPQGETI